MATSTIPKSLASELATASANASRASNALGERTILGHGASKRITFSGYSTSALIYIALNTDPILYIFSNGYLVPVVTSSKATVTLSSDYLTVTIKNNDAVVNGVLGVICNPPVTFTIT